MEKSTKLYFGTFLSFYFPSYYHKLQCLFEKKFKVSLFSLHFSTFEKREKRTSHRKFYTGQWGDKLSAVSAICRAVW